MDFDFLGTDDMAGGHELSARVIYGGAEQQMYPSFHLINEIQTLDSLRLDVERRMASTISNRTWVIDVNITR